MHFCTTESSFPKHLITNSTVLVSPQSSLSHLYSSYTDKPQHFALPRLTLYGVHTVILSSLNCGPSEVFGPVGSSLGSGVCCRLKVRGWDWHLVNRHLTMEPCVCSASQCHSRVSFVLFSLYLSGQRANRAFPPHAMDVRAHTDHVRDGVCGFLGV